MTLVKIKYVGTFKYLVISKNKQKMTIFNQSSKLCSEYLQLWWGKEYKSFIYTIIQWKMIHSLVTLNNSSDNLSKSSGRSRSQGIYNFLNWPMRTPDMLQLTNHRTGNVECGHPESRSHWHELPTINHSVLVSPSQYNFLFFDFISDYWLMTGVRFQS